MSLDSSLHSGDDNSWSNPTGTLTGLMQTDPTEAGDSPTLDEGFTQAWDTVGAGVQPTHVRESSPEKSVKLRL